MSQNLYGLCGFIGSGKNTAAEALKETHTVTLRQPKSSCQILSFAEPLKDAVATIFGWNRQMLEGTSQESRAWREQPDPYWSTAFGRPFTPRHALQYVGTDLFRAWEDNIWIAANAHRLQDNGTAIFSDMRFFNEMKWVYDTKGLLIWIYRPNPVSLNLTDQQTIAHWVREKRSLGEYPLTLTSTAHPSETSFLTEGRQLIDIVVLNTTGAADLYSLMEHIVRLNERLTLTYDFPYRVKTLYLETIPATDDAWHFKWSWRQNQSEPPVYAIFDSSHQFREDLSCSNILPE